MKTQEKSQINPLSCTLTSQELRERKRTILTALRQQVMEKKELEDGYAFKFSGTDTMLDFLLEFVKTERACCSFFDFHLYINGNKGEILLELTGPEGVKTFITTELAL